MRVGDVVRVAVQSGDNVGLEAGRVLELVESTKGSAGQTGAHASARPPARPPLRRRRRRPSDAHIPTPPPFSFAPPAPNTPAS